MTGDFFSSENTGAPWYYRGYEEPEYRNSEIRDYLSYTPQDIKAILEKDVVDQEEACRKVAVMIYQHLHGHRFVGMLAGPTGSGKTFIAENLKKAFPDLVYLRDISNVSCDGWNGKKKVSSLFEGVRAVHSCDTKIYPILFLDECDKLFNPKYSMNGGNVSENVQNEFLSAIQGGEVLMGENIQTVSNMIVDTSHMSFLFAGAFEKKAQAIADKESGAGMGFTASLDKQETYGRELTMDDVHEAGCITELCGRIQKLVCLTKIDEEAYRKMLDEHDRGPLHEMEKEFRLSINISPERRGEMAHTAYIAGLGARGLKNLIRDHIDELTWEDCHARVLNIC